MHHGGWWLYYRDAGRAIRRVADDRDTAEEMGTELNVRLASGKASLLAFIPVSVTELRRAFPEHHELVLNSAAATVRR